MPDSQSRPDGWGVHPGYTDAAGTWRQAPDGTVTAVHRSMGADPDLTPPPSPVWVVHEGDRVDLGGRWELHTEDGETQRVAGSMPAPPAGYHDLFREDDGRGLRLVVAPRTCHLPEELRAWGWSAQLYASRSRWSWGMGDLGDLQRLGRWARQQGAALVLINPLHASVPVPGHQQDSPYFPSSRTFRNPLYLDVLDVPGAAALGSDLDAAVAAGRALNSERRIDRDAVLRLKLEMLERLHPASVENEAYASFVEAGGQTLRRFALHCALAETHGGDWRRWPPDLRHPASFEARQFAEGRSERVRFHMWLQWLLERQLEAAGSTIDLVQDVAVGVDPGGADAWIWQDVLAPGVTVGAPPDEYNVRGQDWGVPAFDPWKLRQERYQPFVEMVRANLRHAGGLRLDHVMGLFRLYWVPDGSPPTDGTYVSYPAQDLLAILALESRRAGAYVVGEDLGTVEPSTRDELARHAVLSYRLVWFEEQPPESFPDRALAAVSTHDLPTVAGLWSGSDLEAQRARGMSPNEDSTSQLTARLREWTGLDEQAPVPEAVQRVHQLLARAPSMIVTASLDDALGVAERPNYPGTVGGTNWSTALPVPLEDIETDPGVLEVARVLGAR